MVDKRTNTVGFSGMRLRQLRKEAGMSQEDLADAIHKNQQEVSDYERGAVVPSTGLIIQLAQLFNVSTDYLLNLTDAPTSQHEARNQPEVIDELLEAISKNNLGKATEIIARLIQRNN